MAATSSGTSGGRLNFRDPGAKEYVLAGALTIAAFLAWQWWKNRGATAAPAATAAAPARSSTPTGMSTEDLKIWIHDHHRGPPKHHKKAGK